MNIVISGVSGLLYYFRRHKNQPFYPSIAIYSVWTVAVSSWQSVGETYRSSFWLHLVWSIWFFSSGDNLAFNNMFISVPTSTFTFLLYCSASIDTFHHNLNTGKLASHRLAFCSNVIFMVTELEMFYCLLMIELDLFTLYSRTVYTCLHIWSNSSLNGHFSFCGQDLLSLKWCYELQLDAFLVDRIWCRILEAQKFRFRLVSQQGPQTGASHRRAVVCEQLAKGCYLIVERPGVECSDHSIIRHINRQGDVRRTTKLANFVCQ